MSGMLGEFFLDGNGNSFKRGGREPRETASRARAVSVYQDCVVCVCLNFSLLHSFHKSQLIHKTISDTRFRIVVQDCKLIQTPSEVSVIAILFV